MNPPNIEKWISPCSGSFPVTFPLGVSERRARQRQYHESQRDEQVKQPLGIDKPIMKRIPQSTQSLPFPLPRALPFPYSYRKDKPPRSQMPATLGIGARHPPARCRGQDGGATPVFASLFPGESIPET